MRIAFVFPSRSRNKKFFAALDNILDNVFLEDHFIFAKLDKDDVTMNNIETKERLEKEYPEVIVKWGYSKNKIHACNRHLEDLPPCDIIVLMSDDMKWIYFGFDEEIRNAFEKLSPNLDSVIHFPEDKSAERTMVLTIMGINLYKKLGYLYWPEYQSVYCDNDLTEMCRKMGKYHFVKKKLYVHNHPIWQKSEWDEQYKKNEAPDVYKKDHSVYIKRKANNFGL